MRWGVRWPVYVLFYAILLNVPFWLAAFTTGLMVRGWFCISFTLLGIACLFLPRVLAPFLVLLLMGTDILNAICLTYYLSPSQLLSNVDGAASFSCSRILCAALVLLLALALAAAARHLTLRPGESRKLAILVLLLLGLGSIGIDCTQAVMNNHTTRLSHGSIVADSFSSGHFGRSRLSRMPLRSLVLYRDMLDPQMTGVPTTPQPARAAFSQVLGGGPFATHSPVGSQPDIVLVLVESWGLAGDPALRSALTAPYEDAGLRSRYNLVQGQVPFFGPTVVGEARELCGNTLGFRILHTSSAQLASCAPQRLAAAGYHTTAVHGMEGHFFDRVTWYRSIGFQETWFHSQLSAIGLPTCVGPFRGSCDSAIADWIGTRLSGSRNSSPQFIYWVTLNSHLPVPTPAPLPHPASCGFSSALAASPALCSWFQLVTNVHQSVARLAASTQRPTLFILVGDHAPPFGSPDLRAQFSVKDVPYIALVPTH